MQLKRVVQANILVLFMPHFATFSVNNAAREMPSPHQTIPLVLSKNNHLKILQQGQVNGNISAQNSVVNDNNPVRFQINPIQFHYGKKPFSRTVELHLLAQNTLLDRPYTTLNTPLKSEFPAQLLPQPIDIIPILATDTATLQTQAKNRGRMSLGSGASRSLRVQWRKGEDANTVVAADIERLGSDEIYNLNTTTAFPSEAIFGQAMQFYADLLIEPIHCKDSLITIQRQAVTVQLTKEYKPTKSGFTLVFNKESGTQMVNHWTEVLESFSNQPVSLWDSSYYSTNPFAVDAFLEDCKYSTVVILNNSYQMAINPSQHFSETLNNDLLNLAANKQMKLLVIADHHKSVELQETEYQPCQKTGLRYESIDELMKVLLLDDKPDSVHIIPREKSKQQLVDLLKSTFPNRKYVVHQRNNQSVITRIPGQPFVSNHKRPFAEFANQESRRETWIARDKQIVINGVSFANKLNFLFSNSHSSHKEFAAAIASDLKDEQNNARRSQSYGSWWKKIVSTYQHDFTQELQQMQLVVEKLKEIESQGDIKIAYVWAPLVINLLQQLRDEINLHTSFWQRLKHWLFSDTNELINESAMALCDKAGENLSTLAQHTKDLPCRNILNLGLCLQKIIEQHQTSLFGSFFAQNKRTVTVAKEMILILNGKEEGNFSQIYADLLEQKPLSDLYEQLKSVLHVEVSDFTPPVK